MRILVALPELKAKGGSERVIASLAKHFKLDIVTNVYEPERTFEEIRKANIFELKQKNKTLFGIRLLAKKFDGYDVFHSHGYFVNNLVCVKNHPNLWYCLTPKRDLYVLHEHFLAQQKNIAKRTLKDWYLHSLKFMDKPFVNSFVDNIVTISNVVAERVKGAYNRSSIVIYPPTDTSKFKCKGYDDFYLCPGRLVREKRIDMVIECFNRINKKLIIAGWCSDVNYYEYLKNKIKSSNIQFVLNPGDDELIDLYSRCAATIYVPVQEEFGLIPVESMASGKPCIVANEGGLQETVIHNVTGLLIEPNVESLIRAINCITLEKAEGMKKDCVKRARLFDEKIFVDRMNNFYKNLITEKS